MWQCGESSGEDSVRVRDTEVGLKLTKLGELDDIEGYLTTSEHIMAAYKEGEMHHELATGCYTMHASRQRSVLLSGMWWR